MTTAAHRHTHRPTSRLFLVFLAARMPRLSDRPLERFAPAGGAIRTTCPSKGEVPTGHSGANRSTPLASGTSQEACNFREKTMSEGKINFRASHYGQWREFCSPILPVSGTSHPRNPMVDPNTKTRNEHWPQRSSYLACSAFPELGERAADTMAAPADL
jgi:hypothetical protein